MNDRVHVAYRLHGRPDRAAERAEALALEQSIEMPRAAIVDARIERDVVAKVERIELESDHSSIAHLSLALETIGADAGQLINMLFGNSSLHDDVEVCDLEIPAELATVFGGPTLGVAGLRRMVGVDDRPLTCTALKPIGSSVAELVRMTRAFAAAGIDFIKDDHGWRDGGTTGFSERVVACQDALEQAAHSGSTVYAPNLSGSLDSMRRQIRFAQDHGVRAVLIAPMICGVANFHQLRREYPGLAFLGHPALGGHQIEPALLLGKLFRLFGADAVIFPNHGGRFSYAPARCSAIADNLRSPWHELLPALPVPAGGMSIDRVADLVADYGRDTMLLMGGSLLVARENLAVRSGEFVGAVAAAAKETIS